MQRPPGACLGSRCTCRGTAASGCRTGVLNGHAGAFAHSLGLRGSQPSPLDRAPKGQAMISRGRNPRTGVSTFQVKLFVHRGRFLRVCCFRLPENHHAARSALECGREAAAFHGFRGLLRKERESGSFAAALQSAARVFTSCSPGRWVRYHLKCGNSRPWVKPTDWSFYI